MITRLVKVFLIIPMVYLMLILLVLLAPCRTPNIPLGVWHSEEANMTLFIDPALDPRFDRCEGWGGTFPGRYMRNGEEVSITIQIESKGAHVSIYIGDVIGPTFSGYFYGRFFIEDGSLHIRDHPHGLEPDEIRTIVFELVEEVSFPK